MALEFDEHVAAPEDGGKAVECLVRAEVALTTEGCGEWAFFSTRQTDQA